MAAGERNIAVISRRPHLERILCSAFGLTQAEAWIALGITRGESLTTIAEARGIAVATARTQLKSVFAKTRTHRQAELAAFVSRIENREMQLSARSSSFSKPLI